jgi:NitT/TauT family transport system substrate-binding protein
LKIGYLSTIYHTSFILKSQDFEFIDKIKIDLEWILYPTGPAIMDAFSSGEIDLGYVGLTPVMIGIDKGLRLKCVAGGHVEGTLMISSDSYHSVNELGSVHKVLKQFDGGSIGTPAKGCIHDVILRDLIQDLNISVINYPWADFIPDAIDNGEILAGMGTPSLAIVASRQFRSKILIHPSKLWPNNPSYGIILREELINSNPDFIKEFLVAHEAACNLIRKQPWQAAEVTAELMNIDVDFVLETYDISPKYCASLPSTYIKSTIDFIPVMKEFSYIKKNLNEEDIFNLEFIQTTHTEPPHY